MQKGQSRRQLLSMVGTAHHSADEAAPAPPASNTHQVRSYQISLAITGEIKVRLTSAMGGEVYDIALEDGETKEHFMKLLQAAIGGRGRMSLEVDRDTNSIRTFVLDVP